MCKSTITILGKSVKLYSDIGAPNPSEDAVWLAAAIPQVPLPTAAYTQKLSTDTDMYTGGVSKNSNNIKLLEVGCGTGAVSLCYLEILRKNGSNNSSLPIIFGLDINKLALEIAHKNAQLNQQAENFLPREGDILHNSLSDCNDCKSPANPPHKFHHSFANPPYHRSDRGFSSPSSNKQTAHGIQQKNVAIWVNNLISKTIDGGTVTIINHINNKELLLSAAKDFPVKIVYLYSSPNKPAKKIILQIHKKNLHKIEEFNLKTYDKTIRKKVLGKGENIWQFCERFCEKIS